MIKKIPAFIFLFFFGRTFSQDTLINKNNDERKFKASFYLDVPFVYLEQGIWIQYFFKADHYFELKYGFSIFDFNIYSGSNDIGPFGDGPVFDFPAGYGHIIKLGYGFYDKMGYIENRDAARKRIKRNHTLRITYKNIFFPVYEYIDGSPGLSYTPIYRQSEKRQVFVFNYVMGWRLSRLKTFGFDFNMLFGVGYNLRNVRRHSVNSFYSNSFINDHQTKSFFRPSAGVEIFFHITPFGKKK